MGASSATEVAGDSAAVPGDSVAVSGEAFLTDCQVQQESERTDTVQGALTASTLPDPANHVTVGELCHAEPTDPASLSNPILPRATIAFSNFESLPSNHVNLDDPPPHAKHADDPPLLTNFSNSNLGPTFPDPISCIGTHSNQALSNPNPDPNPSPSLTHNQVNLIPFEPIIAGTPNPPLRPCEDSTQAHDLVQSPSDHPVLGEVSDESNEESDFDFPPGFTPDKDDMKALREIMRDGASLVPPEYQQEFILSVDLAKDDEILEFFQDKVKKNSRSDTNYMTYQNVRCSPRIRKKPARLTDLPSTSGLKKGFLK